MVNWPEFLVDFFKKIGSLVKNKVPMAKNCHDIRKQRADKHKSCYTYLKKRLRSWAINSKWTVPHELLSFPSQITSKLFFGSFGNRNWVASILLCHPQAHQFFNVNDVSHANHVLVQKLKLYGILSETIFTINLDKHESKPYL